MFGRLRLQLTLWYVGILAVTLMAVGAVVYGLVARSLDGQINDSLREVNGQAAEVLRAAEARGPEPDEPFEDEHERDEEFRGVLSAEQFGSAGDVSLLVLDPSGDVIANPGQVDTASLPLNRATGGELRDVRIAGDRVRLLTTEVASLEGGTAGYVVTIKPLAERDGDLRRLLVLLAAGGAVGLLIAGAGGLWVAQLAIRPVREAFQRQREFVADASHELRTPLAVVRANAEALLAKASPGDREALEDVVADAALMGRLVSDLLTLAQADQAELELEREAVELSALAGTVVREYRPLARDRGVELHAQGEDVSVTADADRLRELLFILLDNAIRHTPAGGAVTLTVGRERDGAVLAVQDTGAGIAPEHLPHVFERFYRVDKARSRSEGGLGLGLSIAQALARAHGGAIAIDSEAGWGTRVRVTLPGPSHMAESPPAEQAAARHAG